MAGSHKELRKWKTPSPTPPQSSNLDVDTTILLIYKANIKQRHETLSRSDARVTGRR